MTDSTICRTVLPNGVRVITERMPHVRSVSVGIWVGTGSRQETGDAERHHPLHRAHAVQGHHLPQRRGDRALGGFDRRQPGRLHRQGTGELQHQGAGRAPAARLRRSLRSGTEPALPSRGHREGEGRHPRRAEDGRGQPRVPGPRDLLFEFLEGSPDRQADSRHARDGQGVSPAMWSRSTTASATCRRTLRSRRPGT